MTSVMRVLFTSSCWKRCAPGFSWSGVFIFLLWSPVAESAEYSKPRNDMAQTPASMATDPQMPSSQLQTIPAGEMPQSARDWRYPHTKQIARFTVQVGDQGGGPIRYNTRFPEVKGNPQPTSYYHTAPFVGAEIEFALTRGGIILGGLARRDLWHNGIEGRSIQMEDKTLAITNFNYTANAFVVGWVFGERYREAPWTSDLSLVYDTATIKINMKPSTGAPESEGRARLIALSLRGRLQFWWMTSQTLSLGIGPEIHAPLYSSTQIDSDSEIETIISNKLQFRSSAAVGAGASASFAF